jgi:glycosyltransferase involved in cell wall biosynthesis
VVPTYVPAWRHGGPVRAVHGLCKALAVRGHEVTVFTTALDAGGPPLDRPVAIDGVAVRYFPLAAPRRLYRAPSLAAALAGAVPACDAVHLHSVYLWPTAAAARAAAWEGVPYLVAPRGMLVPDLVRRRGRLRKLAWLGLVERRTLDGAAALHVTSELEAREAGRLACRLGLPLPPAVVVANGVEDEPAPADGALLSEAVRAALARRPLLLFLGRVSWKKGLDRLIRALPRVLALAPGATLAIAGNDDEALAPALLRLAADLGVAGSIAFLGEVHGADKAALLHGADLLALASYSENFGNAVLEAMAAGCPVTVTPEVGIAEAIVETGAGIVAEGDPAALGGALGALLANPATRREMGERGAAAARERFGWGPIAARMEAVYRSLATGGAADRR